MGSEMCIRDSACSALPWLGWLACGALPRLGLPCLDLLQEIQERQRFSNNNNTAAFGGWRRLRRRGCCVQALAALGSLGAGQGKADRAEARHSKRASRAKAEHSRRGGRAKLRQHSARTTSAAQPPHSRRRQLCCCSCRECCLAWLCHLTWSALPWLRWLACCVLPRLGLPCLDLL